jgi:hypothetical protein
VSWTTSSSAGSTRDDGAIVLGPDAAMPRFLRFDFDQQTF